MSDDKQALTGQQIADESLVGWRKVLDRLVVRYETGDFNTGTTLVTRIAEAADEANHHPDVDLRYPHVTVSLKSHDVNAITQRDVRLARVITELAAEVDVRESAAAPDIVELALDTGDREAIKPFWQAILGYRAPEDVPDELRDSAERMPSMWFQDSDSQAPDRQRWHLDISVPHDVAQQRIQAAIDAGGTLVSDQRAPAFWVLADPDGNQACICTWQSRD
jgi:4a-hydroxytetrahydrobiopterin dehydratase